MDVESKLHTESYNGHIKNITKLIGANNLAIAGPIDKSKIQYREILVLNVKSKEDAEELLQIDPAIKNKYLFADLYDWHGSEALPIYLGSFLEGQKV